MGRLPNGLPQKKAGLRTEDMLRSKWSIASSATSAPVSDIGHLNDGCQRLLGPCGASPSTVATAVALR